MKEVVDEGLRMFLGDRLRVSLADCSPERLESMLAQIDVETARLKTELEEAEEEVRGLYGSADNVSLEYVAGQYQFPLDRYKERLIDRRERIEDLFEKRKPIFKAFQEKYLEEKQAEILGSPKRVKLKDRFIFGLIIMVLILLAVDAGNVGAPGSGAELRPVVENGTVVSVEIVNGGKGYTAARAVPAGSTENPGIGLEVILEVDQGRIAAASVLGGGSGYDDSLQLVIRPRLSPGAQHIFWIIDSICCLIFLVNFFFELSRSSSKKWYWRTHWIDFITSIPMPPAQVLAGIGFSGGELIRAGRLIRILRLLRALRALRLFLFMWRGLDHFAELFDVQLMKKSFGAGLAVLILGAVMITLFGEKGEGNEAVNGFLPGLWWSFTTLVTGGFGDIYNPHTLMGRLLTVFLVIAGMVLVGVFTATLTTILVGKEERAQAALQNELLDRIEAEASRTEEAIRRMEARQEQFGEKFEALQKKLDSDKG
ncbi:MAG: potassium channel family protein [Verrucomicrobiales bacterium]|jgi:voltage-gated potassium channel|nr:potassium channel family protein [Verrucomicrobiales bacterium]